MKSSTLLACLCAAFAAAIAPAQTALTIYNQNFAVVRERIALELKKGVNDVAYAGATLHVEPDSVVLRDPDGRVALRILEQSYRADTLSQALLLHLHEGKEIDFLVYDRTGVEPRKIRGKIIRSGYAPNRAAFQRYGQPFYATQMVASDVHGGGSPIIEVEGQLRFSLPGEPVFPAMAAEADTILKPTLTWRLESERAAKVEAELSYITGGMSWEAAYNLLAPEKGDTLDLVGWVTIDNQSGKTFEGAAIKLMAGDVSKIAPNPENGYMRFNESKSTIAGAPEATVTEKAFDEYHLYSLPRPTTVRNRETKQVEFLRVAGVKTATVYLYNGAAIDWNRYRGWNPQSLRSDRDLGTESNPKVWVMREFKNTKANGLGVPLPKGRTRFYRRDDADGRLEFTGENTIDHTPEGELVRIRTGDAFDLVGERRRTDYQLNNANDQLEEAFEIKLRNRKKEPVEIRVSERLYRWLNWQVIENSESFVKVDSRDIEFRITLQPDEEKVVTYRVRYDWK